MKKKLIKISNWIYWLSLPVIIIAAFGCVKTNAFSLSNQKPNAIYWLYVIYSTSGLFIISAIVTFITDVIMSPTIVEK